MNLTLLRAEGRAIRRAGVRVMRNSLSLVGLLSVGVAGVIATHPEYAHAIGRWIVPATEPPVAPLPLLPQQPDPLAGAIASPGSNAGRMLGLVVPPAAAGTPSGAVTLGKVSAPSHSAAREQRDAVQYLSRKYRVNSDAVAMLVDAAYVTGKDLDLDPLLLLSVMGVESGFNPFAESTAGASGLMQLMSKVHRDKLNDFGGANIALNPVVNLRVGAVVLKDCIRRGGSVADGLRLYVGAGTGVDGGYGLRVLQEKDKLAQAVHATTRVRTEPLPVAASRATSPSRDAAARREAGTDDAVDPTIGEQAVDPERVRAARGRIAAL